MIKRVIFKFILIIVPFFSYSAEDFKTGMVIDTIKCISDTNYSYSAYLPSNYSPVKKWPIYIGFEPAARGMLPVEKYHELAEKYQFILICSNNSQNGDWAPMINAAKITIDDINKRFSIDTEKIYTYGFSGGGRLATLVAMENNSISAVINCGAGFPNNMLPSFPFKFQFICTIGLKDFNYNEVKNLEKQLKYLKVNYSIIPFDSTHIWPEIDVFENAIIQLKMESYKKNKSAFDLAYLADYHQILTNSFNDSLNFIIKESKYKLIIDLEKRLNIDTAFFLNQYQDMVNSNIYKQLQKSEIEISHIEKDYQKKLLNEIVRMNNSSTNNSFYRKSWWKSEINQINQWKNGNEIAYKYLGIRLINFIYACSSENVSFNSISNNYQVLLDYVSIMKLCYPENYYSFYIAASIYARMGNVNSCIKELEYAIEKGFKNKDYLMNDTDFDIIKKDKKFLQIVERIY